MDEEYDVVVCGTGLKECIISGLLSVNGKKVLHVDRNPYYGGESASLNLTNLYEKFRGGAPPPTEYGPNRDWNVDLIPKFVMASGKLVKILLHTKIEQYFEWKPIEGSYVYQFQDGFFDTRCIHKVPASQKEAVSSKLMGIMEKYRFVKFCQYCQCWDRNNPTTHSASGTMLDPNRNTMADVYKCFGLKPDTIAFIGHAIALHTTDDYIDAPMGDTMEKIVLYIRSFEKYYNAKSPFLYPIYGLGVIPEGFARLCAIHGGTYMLNKPVDGFVYNDEGKVVGVQSNGEVAKCKLVVCDPSYVLDTPKIRKAGQVVRCICIMSQCIPNTNDSSSSQIIIPQKQVNRKHDIYVTMVSSAHGVSKTGKFIAIVSTVVETEDPKQEIAVALGLLGKIDETFWNISNLWLPTDDGKHDNVHVSASFDATSHFESASDDVLRIWQNIMGEPLDLSVRNREPESSAESEGR